MRPRPPRPSLDESALFDYAVKALARRMRTEREIEQLLSRRAEPGEAGAQKIAAVLARLKECRYLDDSTFALTYARLRRENDGFGRGRVQREMVRKGVDRDRVASAIHAAYGDENEAELARRFLVRKRISKPEDAKQTARIIRRLLTAGFTYSTIAVVLRNWDVEVDETAFSPPEEAG